ncbi:hypothetical protein D9Q98_002993 [Chlorella vulgaris]|uniref:Uncharacterized protein n=1 Tax=Chlorella vulgaris TaxID=3077 RepID=A0A9D4TUT1_CHLVU|nr:hypothetical protein D9Q98_002993 [Chlorella vulgaris]
MPACRSEAIALQHWVVLRSSYTGFRLTWAIDPNCTWPPELQDSFFQAYGCSEVPANAVTACRCSTLILRMPVAWGDRLRGLRDEWDLSTLACGWAVVRSRAQRVRCHLLTYEPHDGCMPDWLRGKDGQVVAAWSRNVGLGCAMLAAVRLGAKRDSRSRTRTATSPPRPASIAEWVDGPENDAEAQKAEGPPGAIEVLIPSYSLALAPDPLLCASTAHPFKGQHRGFEPDPPAGLLVLAGRKLGVLAAGSIEAAVALAAGSGTRIWPPNGLTAPDHTQQQQRAAQHFP